jgi:small subunit ribosomal protein S1
VSVAIGSIENGYGDTILSRDKAKRLASWMSLEKALESGEFVTGTISGKVKGGLTVLVNGIRAFLPGSLVDTRPVKDTDAVRNKTMEFKVIKLDRKRNNVVLSPPRRGRSLHGRRARQAAGNLKEGAIVKGVVKNITDYGAFVDLGGIDGLLHITDMAWRRVRHPSEVVPSARKSRQGPQVRRREEPRLAGPQAAGRRSVGGRLRRYPQGTRLFGKVTNIADYGAFVEIEQGIEGLVHVSEMDWTNKNVAPVQGRRWATKSKSWCWRSTKTSAASQPGHEAVQGQPVGRVRQNTKRGDKVKGPIKSITDFGVFVGLAAGIDGLVHLSDLSWNETGEAAVRNYKKGQEVEAIVLAVDVERERISLGIKQLDGDPFTTFVTVNDKGQW